MSLCSRPLVTSRFLALCRACGRCPSRPLGAPCSATAPEGRRHSPWLASRGQETLVWGPRAFQRVSFPSKADLAAFGGCSLRSDPISQHIPQWGWGPSVQWKEPRLEGLQTGGLEGLWGSGEGTDCSPISARTSRVSLGTSLASQELHVPSGRASHMAPVALG